MEDPQYEIFRHAESKICDEIKKINAEIKFLENKRYQLKKEMGEVSFLRNKYWHESNGRDNAYFERLNRKYVNPS
jgi:hypothetical protein